MAGKRQHYVPRLLQRGFLNDLTSKSERTWLHRFGADARLVSIRDVGVEDWFYSRKSHDGMQTLDDAITEFERDLAESVRAIRTSIPGSLIDASEAAHTVVHLVMRTAHLRQVITAGMARITNEIESIFTDSERLADMLGITGSVLSPVMLEEIRNNAEKLVPDDIPVAFSERVMAFVMREHSDYFNEQAVATTSSIFPELLSGLVGKVRDAHNSILATSPESNGWETALTSFVWTVEFGENFILPDAVALACEDNGPLMPLLFNKATDVRVVVMPISSDRVLVGRVPDSMDIDLSQFNTQAAACCNNFFISAKPLGRDNLATLIGSALSNTLEETISTAVQEARLVRSTAGKVSHLIKPHTFVQQGFSFNVRLADFGDEILAKELSDVLHGVVDALSHNIPLHDLDGITIAVDYHGALATIDRGNPDLPSVTSNALSYGQSVAKPVTVVRDGSRKEHLVIAASIAEMWLSSDAKVRAAGLYTLTKMLAGIAHSTQYARAKETHFSPDIMGRMFHNAIAATPSMYWSASQVASIDPDQGQIYSELVIKSLDFAEQEIAKERARIPKSGDIGDATMCALECVSAVLGHTADWLGHRDGLAEGQAFAGSDLPELLKVRGLDRWIELYSRDLAACYGQHGVLNSDVVITLNQHVERVFWSLGIYCWPSDDDVRCLFTAQPFPSLKFS